MSMNRDLIYEITLSNWFAELVEQADRIELVSRQIDYLARCIINEDNVQGIFPIICKNLYLVLSRWTKNTYVGSTKPIKFKKAIQSFFCSLYHMLHIMKESKVDVFRNIADIVLYQGVVYRYLGSSLSNNKIRTKPVFDSIYVSWSKHPRNSYLEGKLHGPYTILTCHIANDLFGIDLEPFGVCLGTEAEVVFPTLENCIHAIEYYQ